MSGMVRRGINRLSRRSSENKMIVGCGMSDGAIRKLANRRGNCEEHRGCSGLAGVRQEGDKDGGESQPRGSGDGSWAACRIKKL